MEVDKERKCNRRSGKEKERKEEEKEGKCKKAETDLVQKKKNLEKDTKKIN